MVILDLAMLTAAMIACVTGIGALYVLMSEDAVKVKSVRKS